MVYTRGSTVAVVGSGLVMPRYLKIGVLVEILFARMRLYSAALVQALVMLASRMIVWVVVVLGAILVYVYACERTAVPLFDTASSALRTWCATMNATTSLSNVGLLPVPTIAIGVPVTAGAGTACREKTAGSTKVGAVGVAEWPPHAARAAVVAMTKKPKVMRDGDMRPSESERYAGGILSACLAGYKSLLARAH